MSVREWAGARILVADDSNAARLILSRSIMAAAPKSALYEVSDGRAAIEAFDRVKPTISFLDIYMPDVTGLDALQAIRKRDANAHVIVMSGDGSPARVAHATSLGASDFVTKPYTPAAICAALERAIAPRAPSAPAPAAADDDDFFIDDDDPVAEPAVARVLLVDDSRTHRAIMKRIIAQTKVACEVTEAEDGSEAITLYSEHTFDLVLLDVNMRRLGGLVALEGVMAANAKAKVVMISGNDDQEIIAECKGLGARDFLVKPISADTLRASLVRCGVAA